MTKLPYTSFADLKADFDAGVKFEVRDHGYSSAVVNITIRAGSGKSAKVHTEGGRAYSYFEPNGINTAAPQISLVQTSPVPLTAQKPAEPAKTVEKSFLERFMAGEEFHTAKTRETVANVSFDRGHNRMTVTLQDEKGKRRTTPRYNLDGTHKFHAVRNLVAGKLPPETVDIEVTIYRNAYNDSLFCIRKGEILPNVPGVSNAIKVGETTIKEPKRLIDRIGK